MPRLLTEGCCFGICETEAGCDWFQCCLQDRKKTGWRGDPRLSRATMFPFLSKENACGRRLQPGEVASRSRKASQSG